MNKREVGTKYEQVAAKYLQDAGMKIIEQNFRNRFGEIDLIGRHEGYLVFVEVKYRTTDVNGLPEEAVDFHKQKKICSVADYYRCCLQLPETTPVRYDVVTIYNDRCTWYKNAFEHIYSRSRVR